MNASLSLSKFSRTLCVLLIVALCIPFSVSAEVGSSADRGYGGSTSSGSASSGSKGSASSGNSPSGSTSNNGSNSPGNANGNSPSTSGSKGGSTSGGSKGGNSPSGSTSNNGSNSPGNANGNSPSGNSNSGGLNSAGNRASGAGPGASANTNTSGNGFNGTSPSKSGPSAGSNNSQPDGPKGQESYGGSTPSKSSPSGYSGPSGIGGYDGNPSPNTQSKGAIGQARDAIASAASSVGKAIGAAFSKGIDAGIAAAKSLAGIKSTPSYSDLSFNSMVNGKPSSISEKTLNDIGVTATPGVVNALKENNINVSYNNPVSNPVGALSVAENKALQNSIDSAVAARDKALADARSFGVGDLPDQISQALANSDKAVQAAQDAKTAAEYAAFEAARAKAMTNAPQTPTTPASVPGWMSQETPKANLTAPNFNAPAAMFSKPATAASVPTLTKNQKVNTAVASIPGWMSQPTIEANITAPNFNAPAAMFSKPNASDVPGTFSYDKAINSQMQSLNDKITGQPSATDPATMARAEEQDKKDFRAAAAAQAVANAKAKNESYDPFSVGQPANSNYDVSFSFSDDLGRNIDVKDNGVGVRTNEDGTVTALSRTETSKAYLGDSLTPSSPTYANVQREQQASADKMAAEEAQYAAFESTRAQAMSKEATAKAVEAARYAAFEATRAQAMTSAPQYSTTDYSSWPGLGDEMGQKLGQSYSGPKGAGSLSKEAYAAAAKSAGFDMPSVAATDDEIDEMTRMVLAETRSIKNAAGKMSIPGAVAVAEVIRNRTLSTSFPNTVTDVVNQHNKKGTYQFSPAKNATHLNDEFGPTNPNYGVTKEAVKSVLNGTSVPTAVTAKGVGMVNYGNVATINGPQSQASKATKAAFNSMASKPDSFTIKDASRPNSVQHTFGTIGNPNAPDFSPDDGKVSNTNRPSNTPAPSNVSPDVTTSVDKNSPAKSTPANADKPSVASRVAETVKTTTKSLANGITNSVKNTYQSITSKVSGWLGGSNYSSSEREGGGTNDPLPKPTTEKRPIVEEIKESGDTIEYGEYVNPGLYSLADLAITKLFAEESDKVEHFATIETTENEEWLLVRQAYAEIDGVGYLFEIGSEEFIEGEEFYGEITYFMLTREYKTSQGIVNITFVDAGADGALDYMYVNDDLVDDATVDDFQKVYANDLSAIITHLVE